jgi:DNA-binding response OmpR family regulator
MRMLVSKDDVHRSTTLRRTLRAAGYGVDIVTATAHLLSEARSARYDLLIIDRRLPNDDAIATVCHLRTEGCSIPILMISRKNKIKDRIGGLNAGADDYLTAPFNHHELLARIRALLRRPPAPASALLRAGNLEIDDVVGEVRCSGSPVKLRLAERRLLALLVRQAGKVVPRASIEAELSGLGRQRSTNAIEARVSRLRKALSRVAAAITIETVRGAGYLLSETSSALSK